MGVILNLILKSTEELDALEEAVHTARSIKNNLNYIPQEDIERLQKALLVANQTTTASTTVNIVAETYANNIIDPNDVTTCIVEPPLYRRIDHIYNEGWNWSNDFINTIITNEMHLKRNIGKASKIYSDIENKYKIKLDAYIKSIMNNS